MISIAKHRRSIAVVALLLLATVAVWLSVDSDRGDDMEWLSSPPASRPPRLSFLGRWTWSVRARFSRLKQRVVGPPALVTIDARVTEFDAAALAAAWTSGAGGFTNGSGVRAFVIEDAEPLRQQLALVQAKEISRPRLSAADGQPAQISVGETIVVGTLTNIRALNVGWWLDVCARVGTRSTDVTFFFTGTECSIPPAARKREESVREPSLVRTNAFFGARLRVPERQSLFLISNATNRSGQSIGIVLTPTVQKPPKK